jgi:HTH-type transcriptional regulator/antitoxin MqsA
MEEPLEHVGTVARIHPVTGKALTRAVRPRVLSFGSLSRVVDVPGWYPDDDGDSIHTGRDLRGEGEAFRELRAAYAGRVRKVRKDLGLTQVEAGLLIGGGPRAFQKYEAGVMAPSDAAVGLLEILAVDPVKIDVLRNMRRADGTLGEQAARKANSRTTLTGNDLATT